MKIYIAGKYGSHKLPSEIRLANTMKAIEAGRSVILLGHTPYIPHLTHFVHEGWEYDIGNKYYDLDIEWLECCDAILMLDNWPDSDGAKMEHQRAIALGIAVYYNLEDIPIGCLD